MLKLQIIMGSTRPGRSSEPIARWAYEIAKKRDGAEFELVDIADYNLPLLDEPVPALATAAMGMEYTHAHTKKWSEKITQADGYIFVTPEYNRSMSAALKNAIDFLYKEWNEKAAGFVAHGAEGGARAIAHLRSIAGEVRLADVREELTFFMDHDFENFAFKTPGKKHEQQLHNVIDQVIQWATAMKTIRSTNEAKEAKI